MYYIYANIYIYLYIYIFHFLNLHTFCSLSFTSCGSSTVLFFFPCFPQQSHLLSPNGFTFSVSVFSNSSSSLSYSTALGCQPFCSDSKCFPLPTDYYLTSRLTFFKYVIMISLQCCQDISMAFLCIQPKTQACFLASAYTFSLYSHSAAASSSVFLQLCA